MIIVFDFKGKSNFLIQLLLIFHAENKRRCCPARVFFAFGSVGISFKTHEAR